MYFGVYMPFKVTSHLRGCPSGKIRTRAIFIEILANYRSEESLITADNDKNIIKRLLFLGSVRSR